MTEPTDIPLQEPLDDLPPSRSRLAHTAMMMAVAPPGLAFVSALLGISPLASLAFWAMFVTVPLSLLLGVVAIVRAWARPLMPGAGQGTLAVTVSGGILAFVFWFLENFNPHY